MWGREDWRERDRESLELDKDYTWEPLEGGGGGKRVSEDGGKGELMGVLLVEIIIC